jgi:hypothetical protein
VHVTVFFSREEFLNSYLLTLLLVSSWLPQIPSLTDVRRGPSSSELGAILSLCSGESLQPKQETNSQRNVIETSSVIQGGAKYSSPSTTMELRS